MLPQEAHFKYKDIQIERKGMKKIRSCNQQHEKAGVAVLISDKQASRQRALPDIKRDTP